MNAEEFIKYWENSYQNILPFGHELRLNYPDRWFRIHSLPDAKRYPDSEEEYKEILLRQNSLISDLFSRHPDFLILIAIYSNDINIGEYKLLDYKNEFLYAHKINLHQINPDEYETDMFLDVFIKHATWIKNKFDPILRKIADDQIHMLFVNPSSELVIAPYDGGVDLILKDVLTKNIYKEKYRNWLSQREDGL